MVEVTQADREASWPFRPEAYGLPDKAAWNEGRYDEASRIIKAFARHRIASTPAQVSGEPVAWKITDADGGYWFTNKPENPDQFDCEITQVPLYNHHPEQIAESANCSAATVHSYPEKPA